MPSPYINILVFFLIWSTSINAQNNGAITLSNTCGTDSLMQELLRYPVYRAQYEQRQATLETKLQTIKNRVGGCTDPIKLHLAVHFQEIDNSNQYCLRQLAEDQVRILNEDFQGTNANLTQWTDNESANFPGVSHGQACIE